MPDGRIGHAELSFGGARIALATTWTEGGMASPWSLPAVHSQVYCEVSDVDAHYELAKAEGATIAETPGEPSHGSRNYRALDIEGHRWVFATPYEQE
jgi:PhnB protein